MSRAVRYLPEVAGDVREAARWYAIHNPRLRPAFRSEVHSAVSRACENPGHFRCAYGEFRRILLKRFPYAVWFRVDGEAIIVVTVIHCARDPEELRRRLQERWTE